MTRRFTFPTVALSAIALGMVWGAVVRQMFPTPEVLAVPPTPAVVTLVTGAFLIGVLVVVGFGDWRG